MKELLEILNNKKIKIIEIPKWGPYLRKQWEYNFANHISETEKKSIYLFDNDGVWGYLWHLFSYDKKNNLKEEMADQAFNNEAKSSCFVFYQHSDDALILENASNLTAHDLINELDIYVVDKDFNWTYVKTHETGCCGPYFSRSKQNVMY